MKGKLRMLWMACTNNFKMQTNLYRKRERNKMVLLAKYCTVESVILNNNSLAMLDKKKLLTHKV